MSKRSPLEHGHSCFRCCVSSWLHELMHFFHLAQKPRLVKGHAAMVLCVCSLLLPWCFSSAGHITLQHRQCLIFYLVLVLQGCHVEAGRSDTQLLYSRFANNPGVCNRRSQTAPARGTAAASGCYLRVCSRCQGCLSGLPCCSRAAVDIWRQPACS